MYFGQALQGQLTLPTLSRLITRKHKHNGEPALFVTAAKGPTLSAPPRWRSGRGGVSFVAMTTRTKIREEALVWLTRALLAAVVWATVWGLSYVLVPGVDPHNATAARYLARVESLVVMQDEDNRLQGTYVNVFQHIIERGFDSSRVVRGRDTLLINQWLEHGVGVKVPASGSRVGPSRRRPIRLRLAVLEVLGLTPVNREFARRVQAELGFDASILEPAGDRDDSFVPTTGIAMFKRVQVDRLNHRVSLDTL